MDHPALPFLKRDEKGKVVSAADAVKLIRDGDTLATGGFVGIGFAEELGIEQRFVFSRDAEASAPGHPRDLTLGLFAYPSTPASERRMPTVSPTLTFSTPTPTAMTFPTPSRPRMCGSGGLAGYMPWAKKASAGFSAANFISNSAWPGPGCGSGTSPNRSSSTPLYESINHARITLWYCQVRDCHDRAQAM